MYSENLSKTCHSILVFLKISFFTNYNIDPFTDFTLAHYNYKSILRNTTLLEIVKTYVLNSAKSLLQAKLTYFRYNIVVKYDLNYL